MDKEIHVVTAVEAGSDPDPLSALMRRLNFTNSTDMLVYTSEACEELLGKNYTTVIQENGLNVSCLLHAPTLDNYAISKSFVLGVMAVFSLLGNLLTMYSIHKSKRRRTGHIYSLLYHLSIADLCVTFWCIVGEAIWYVDYNYFSTVVSAAMVPRETFIAVCIYIYTNLPLTANA